MINLKGFGMCLKVLFAIFCFFSLAVFSETVDSDKKINMIGYEALLSKKGFFKQGIFKGIVFVENVSLAAYPAVKNGRLFQGGNPPECVEQIKVPGGLREENGTYVYSKEAILGNAEYPEIIAYKMKMIFSEEDINIYYDIEYLQKLKWRFYGASIVFRLPEKMIAGRGWVSEMSEGSSVRAGHNPKEFKKENRLQWVWIDSGSRLCLETAVGKIQFAAEMPSYLRGGKDSIYVISMPRDKIIAKGTKQKLNLKIILPKIKRGRNAQ